jgi:hypothetical protein
MMPDYNGWADEPEEEREALAEFEMTLANAASKRPPTQAPRIHHRAADRDVPLSAAA